MAEPTEPGGTSRRRLLLMVVPAVVVAVGIGVAGYFAGASGKAEAAPEGEEAEAHAEAPAGEHGEEASAEGAPKKFAPDAAAVISLGTFTVNLRGSGGGRVLRLEVQVEAKGKVAEELNVRLAQVRDAVITSASDYTWPELEGTDGKTRLRDELLARVNGTVAPSAVDHIYFTQFVVQ